MTAPLFGFLDSTKDAIVELVQNCLLVAGGFLVGYLLGGFIGWAFGKWVIRQKAPESLTRLGRPVGGTVLAIIVALIVFTGMGKGPGTGGDGKGSTDSDANKSNPPDKAKIDSKVEIPKVDLSPTGLPVRVTVVAGEAVKTERKYYLIDDDTTPRSLTELQDAIRALKVKANGKVTLAILFPTNPNHAPARNDPKVSDVTRWATEEAGLDVVFPAAKP